MRPVRVALAVVPRATGAAVTGGGMAGEKFKSGLDVRRFNAAMSERRPRGWRDAGARRVPRRPTMDEQEAALAADDKDSRDGRSRRRL